MSDQQIKLDTYDGYLTEHALTISEVLHHAGYDTCTSGKWHLGHAPGHRPLNRGFDQCFDFLLGAYNRWRSAAGVFPYDVVKKRTKLPTP